MLISVLPCTPFNYTCTIYGLCEHAVHDKKLLQFAVCVKKLILDITPNGIPDIVQSSCVKEAGQRSYDWDVVLSVTACLPSLYWIYLYH